MSTKSKTSASSTAQNPTRKPESQTESKRTLTFVITAIGCLLLTGLFEWYRRPAAIKEFGKVGQEFYPDFTDPTTATALSVSVIDPEEVKPLEFSVKQAENGQWVIPSHHNYPADAADQLAKTASSVIGIKRGAMVSRWASDHAQYGVVDPQTDSVGIDELEGIGKRITFAGKDGSVLASYIVGKKVESDGEAEGAANRYYVRHPSEDETYIADLDINLTTRFRDWVNTDLLDITGTNVRRIELNDYSFDEVQGTVTGNVQSTLNRDASTEDWKLAGLDEATQEVNDDAVRETLNTLANLEIAGVRPKQPGLTADLRIDRDALKSQRDADRLTNDLLTRGFLLQPNPDDKNLLELIAREGEMFVGADDGLLYRLYFGRVFTGSDQELEIGLTTEEESSADGDQADKTEKPADAADEDSAEKKEDATTDEAKQDEAGSKPGRYVFVRVNFDPSLLGETLQEPVEPQESEELKALAEKVKQQASGAEPTSDDSAKGDAATDPAQPADEEANAETDAQKLQRMQEEFEAAKVEYRTQRAAYDDYQQKLKDGQQKADELNRRFAAWYYVIPGESYDKLSLDREDLIKSKEAATEVSPADGQTSDALLPQIGELSDAVMKDAAESPSIPLAPATGETPANAEPAKEATPAPETPAPETPAPETPAPETPAPETPAPDDVGDTP